MRYIHSSGVWIFQSTLPREERLCRMRYTWREIYFNPRSHERSDKKDIRIVAAGHDFNPRSHERSDTVAGASATVHRNYHRQHKKFQSTLPREERQGAAEMTKAIREFQSTLPREERQREHHGSIHESDFNPRSHERSDSNIAQKICLFLYNTDNKYIIR